MISMDVRLKVLGAASYPPRPGGAGSVIEVSFSMA